MVALTFGGSPIQVNVGENTGEARRAAAVATAQADRAENEATAMAALLAAQGDLLSSVEHEGWTLVLKNLANQLQFGVDATGLTHATLSNNDSSLGGMLRWDMTVDYEGWFFVILDQNGYLQLGVTTDGEIFPGGDAASLTTEITAARGTRTSLNARMSYLLASTGYATTVYHNVGNLRDWHWKLFQAQAGAGWAVLGIIGDSWSERFSPGYTDRLYTRMQALHGDGGIGWVPMAAGARAASGLAPTITGTWTTTTGAASRGPDFKEITSSTAGDRISIAVPANHTLNRLLWVRKSGGGVFRYSSDNGATWSLNVDTSNATEALGQVDITPPSTAHTFIVEVVSGSVTMLGSYLRKASGFILHRLSMSGTRADQWATAQATRRAAWAALDMDCVQIGPFGTNEKGTSTSAATFEASYRSLIADFRTIRSTMDVVIAASPDSFGTDGAVPMSAYNAAVLDMAYDSTLRVVGIDIQRKWGAKADYGASSSRAFINEGTDTSHPTSNGYWSLTEIFLGLYSYGAR